MSLRRFAASILASIILAAPVAAEDLGPDARTVDATFGWTENDPTAIGCRLYVADADGNFVQVGEDVLLPEATMVVTFYAKGIYVFVATAFNAQGLESEFSLPCTVKAAHMTITQI